MIYIYIYTYNIVIYIDLYIYIYRYRYIGIYIDIILLVRSLSFPVTLSIYLSIRKCPMVSRSASQLWTNWDIFFWRRGIAVSWTVRSAAPAPCATMDGRGNANVPVTSGAVQHPQERRWMYYGSWGIPGLVMSTVCYLTWPSRNSEFSHSTWWHRNSEFSHSTWWFFHS